jgi:predicted ATPase
MINSLSLKNFTSWQDSGALRFAPLTGLFGTNSSGKTSLMQLLLLLKQTADSPDRKLVLNLGDERSPVELGTFQDLAYRHDLSQMLAWRLKWTLPDVLEIADPQRPERALFKSQEMGFGADLAWRRSGSASTGRLVVDRMEYRFGDGEFRMQPVADKPDEYELVSKAPKFQFKRVPGRVWNLPEPARCYGFPDQTRAYFKNAAFLSDFELEFEKLCGRIFYLGPLRDYPKRQYAWGGGRPADMGRRGERVVEALLASREAGETYSYGRGVKRKTLEEVVAQWLKDLNLIHSFEVKPITADSKLYQVWVQRSPDAKKVLLTDVGFGVSQILPVIALCYYAPEGSVLLLEQPEIHLHPGVQAGLADVFIDAIKRRRVQIVLESHSEHLLRRLQRRMAEEAFAAEDAALYFCAIEDGHSHAEELKLDLYGSIENWPKDFFGDEFGEIAETQKAIIKRKKAARA